MKIFRFVKKVFITGLTIPSSKFKRKFIKLYFNE